MQETQKNTTLNLYKSLKISILAKDTIQYNTIQYNTIQYNTIQYNTIQYNTIQYVNTLINKNNIRSTLSGNSTARCFFLFQWV